MRKTKDVIDKISEEEIRKLFKVEDIDEAKIAVWWVESMPDKDGNFLERASLFQNMPMWNLLNCAKTSIIDPFDTKFRPIVAIR
jgi:hypothetical protein